MGTTIRPEVSKNNKWWLPKNRQLELKYYVKQYPAWKTTYEHLGSLSAMDMIRIATAKNPPMVGGSIVEKKVETMVRLSTKIDSVGLALSKVDNVIGPYVLRGIIEDYGYVYFKTKENIPCSKEYYYNVYRQFFWELSKILR